MRASRAAGVLALAAAFVALLASRAGAHALVRSSQPAEGALLSSAPPRVTVTFTEPPDPELSTIRVLDASGAAVTTEPATVVEGNRDELAVPLPALGRGVYTVTWRALSSADGHVTAGSFSFGVGVAPGAVAGPAAELTSPAPSPLGVAGRWALYVGLALLLSAGVVPWAVFRGRLPTPRWVLLAGWGLAAVGLGAVVVAAASLAQTSVGELLRSTTGSGLVAEAVGVAATGGAVLFALARPSRGTFAVLGVATAATMLLHARNSHAGAENVAWVNVGAQWLHLVAVGIWVGGLAWLLVAMRRLEPEERGPAAARFSWLAGLALAAVAATGLIRALDEVGGPADWRRLFDTSFGVTLLVKLALFAALIAFAWRNRSVNVPALSAGRLGVSPLRRAVAVEVALAVGIFGVTGVLTELPPSAEVAKAARRERPTAPPALTVSGHDFATSVRVRLTVTPGTVGPNRFDASVLDYDTGRPVPASSVTLRFNLPGQPSLGQPTVRLRRGAGGTWTGSSTVISMNGRWDVTAVVQQPAGGVEVPLTLLPRLPEQQVDVSRVPGAPTVSTIALPGGASLQAYVDPGRVGRNAVHFTYFDAGGKELRVEAATASELAPDGTPRTLRLRRFSRGHFVANVELRSGRWTFLVDATVAGDPLFAYFRETIDR